MYTLPDKSLVTAYAYNNLALVAGPTSPLLPAVLPAIVVITPVDTVSYI